MSMTLYDLFLPSALYLVAYTYPFSVHTGRPGYPTRVRGHGVRRGLETLQALLGEGRGRKGLARRGLRRGALPPDALHRREFGFTLALASASFHSHLYTTGGHLRPAFTGFVFPVLSHQLLPRLPLPKATDPADVQTCSADKVFKKLV